MEDKISYLRNIFLERLMLSLQEKFKFPMVKFREKHYICNKIEICM